MKLVKLPLFLCASLLLVSCSGQIKGTVFMDLNGDGLPDSTERTLSGVSVKVTHDDQLIGKAKTDAQGNFSIGSKGPGYYCVEIEEPGLNESLMSFLSEHPETVPPASENISLGPPVSSSKQTASTEPTPSTTPICGNGNKEGSEECDDGNKIADDDCTNECKKKQSTPPKPPPPPPKPDKVSSGNVCQNVSGSSFTVHVPVRLDYKADISRMPPPLKQVRKPGEPFSIGIPIPIGCALKSLFIPDSLEVLAENSNARIDPNINRVDFSSNLEESSVKLNLKVKEDIPLGSSTVKIAPQALCRNGETLELNPFEIELKALPAIEISQLIPAEDCKNGGIIHWKITIRNNGNRSFDSVRVEARRPEKVIHQSAPADKCEAQSDGLYICRFGKLAGNTSLEPIIIEVKLPETVTEKISFVFHALVKSPDFTDPQHADDITCTLEKP